MSTTVTHCDGCGAPEAVGDHGRCRARRAATDPPRYCMTCGRKLVVQVLPVGWTARCVRCGAAGAASPRDPGPAGTGG